MGKRLWIAHGLPTCGMTTLERLPGTVSNEHARPLNILLIEDDPNDIIILHKLLEDCGLQFSVLHQSDGAEALDYLQTLILAPNRVRLQLPDVIILDLKMPRVSGHEVLQWLRSQRQFQLVPVLVLTGSALSRDRELCMSNGADEVLCKNTDHSELRAQLIGFLRRALVPAGNNPVN